MDWGISIFYYIVTVVVVLIYGLLLYAFIAKTMARVQGRVGIPIYQPFLDIIQTYNKRTAVTHGVMFDLGPVFRLAGGLGTLAFIPVIYGSEVFGNFHFAGDLLLVMYFVFFGQLGMALGAGESGHPYAAMGVSRGLAQMTAFEVPFALSIIAIFIQYDTASINDIVAAQQGSIYNWTLFTNPFAVIAAMFAFLGMSMYPPFDLVTAPNEIPIGPPTEYHGPYLSFLQTNRSIFAGAKLILFMNLFFGGATNLPVMMVKLWAIYMIPVLIGVAFARFKVEHAIRFFLGIPTLIGIIAVLYVQYWGTL